MQKHLLFAACLLLSLFPAASQAQKKRIAFLGSSTTASFGATTADSGYTHIVIRYYDNLQEVDSAIVFGLPGETTYSAMPTGYIPPTGLDQPNLSNNVTKALELNADIVVVNYPTNDIMRDYGVTSFLANLRAIYKSVIDAHKICYVTTSQPRNVDYAHQLLLQEARDSILLEFGANSINFWTPLVDPSSLNINPIYNADGTHPNNAGHQQLAQAVISANILPSGIVLPLSLTGFSAVLQRSAVLLSWTTTGEDAGTVFELQRSADGVSFQTIDQEKGGSGALHSWSDATPLKGRNFYRLKMTDKESVTYSRIVVVNRPNGLAIDRLYVPSHGSTLFAGINVSEDQSVGIRILNGSGSVSHQRTYRLKAPLDQLSIDISGLAAGTYVLQAAARDGSTIARSFIVF
ncbi:MAG: SGNH/GDSL hydrolase family protein [Bacteroidetes bacterium]|nr:SGNH/GDSL hydrolase family protein [Bacteroidota bacterium]